MEYYVTSCFKEWDQNPYILLPYKIGYAETFSKHMTMCALLLTMSYLLHCSFHWINLDKSRITIFDSARHDVDEYKPCTDLLSRCNDSYILFQWAGVNNYYIQSHYLHFLGLSSGTRRKVESTLPSAKISSGSTRSCG